MSRLVDYQLGNRHSSSKSKDYRVYSLILFYSKLFFVLLLHNLGTFWAISGRQSF